MAKLDIPPARLTATFLIACVGASLGTYVLLDQGALTVSARLRFGDNLIEAVLHYLSFLTVLTNAMLVAVYIWFVSSGRLLRFMRHPSLHAFLAALIIIVGVVWHVMLRSEGMSLNTIYLHYVAPPLYLLWWTLRRPPQAPHYRGVSVLMALPLGYAVWTLARGAVTGSYPYGFVNVPEVGYGATLQMMGFLLATQWVLALSFAAAGRLIANRS
ncbi:MAG: Pr6Pr family membrane protein [Pseudomonadota bacterium]